MSTDVAIVGSGPCGVLAAREFVRAGREVVMIERGALKPHADQLRDKAWEADIPTARHTVEDHPDTEPYPWDYLHAVGGTGLHWTGVSPRFLPSDFETQSRFGVGRDWPISYEDLEPYYVEAERAMAVSGGENPLFPRSRAYPHPPHPYSPPDRLIRGLLDHYHPLPQARPTEVVGGRPPCCGSAQCGLCPVNSRWSPLHTLFDEKLLEAPNFELRPETIATRLVRRGGRVTGIELVGADGERGSLSANTVVVAANGIENAALLLRSQIGGDDVGRWLFDHQHRIIHVRVRESTMHGRGTTLATGVSYAFAEGDFRSERAALLLYPFNPGLQIEDVVIQGVLEGRRGRDIARVANQRFDRTLVLDSVAEDLPSRDRFVELSPNRDDFGIPRNRVHYTADSDYVARGFRVAIEELRRRLRPIGAREVQLVPTLARGGHQIGTCRMGDGEGVVDPNLKVHDVDNLYVVGASAFPSYSAAHPTLTASALAIRLGRTLAES